MLKATRKKRTCLDFNIKLKIIQDKIINQHKTLDQLAAEYGCERKTISKISKDKESIQENQEASPNKKKK